MNVPDELNDPSDKQYDDQHYINVTASQLRNWFSPDLPDEVACAIHQFLIEMTFLFHRAYEDEIRRFTSNCQLPPDRLQGTADDDDQIPWMDDEINF